MRFGLLAFWPALGDILFTCAPSDEGQVVLIHATGSSDPKSSLNACPEAHLLGLMSHYPRCAGGPVAGGGRHSERHQEAVFC